MKLLQTFLITFLTNTILVEARSKPQMVGYSNLPKWEPTYNMSRSTIVQPCNYSGFFDPSYISQFGIVDFDWSNAKQIYVNNPNGPMNCDELLVEQVNMVKQYNPTTKVFKYFNFVKALPWYTYVREKLVDPAYSGWFIKFSNGINGSYHVSPCDHNYNPPLCSDYYHDTLQTPDYPSGDGSCREPCNCGGVPCGEYLFDHRNASLRDFLINEVLLGPTGLGNSNISGFYLDDNWHNTR